MADKKISQLDSASSVSSGAYFPISQSGTTYKGTTDQIGEQIATNQDFNTLNTTSKKVIGAINEVLANSDKDIISSIDTPAPIMTFNDGGDNIPVNKLLVAVTAQQASGTPTPSSPLAITGWSGAKITRCGKNLYSSSFTIGKRANASTGAIEDYSNGACTDYMPIPPSTSIDLLISGLTNQLNSYVSFYDKDKTYLSRTSSGAISQRLLEQPENARYCVVTQVKVTGQTADISIVSGLNVQIEIGTTATTYEAYKGTTVTIPFGSTVYGGILECVQGQVRLRVTKKYWEYDGSSDEDWQVVSGTGKFYIAQQDVVDTYNPNKYSNIYPFSGSATSSASVTVDKSFYTQRNETDLQYNRIWVYNSDYSTVEQFKTALSNQHLQIVADLIVPVVINLTPEQIATLAGLNNIYADCGDIQLLEYFNENADDLAKLIRAMA